jgi:hypothetical protein
LLLSPPDFPEIALSWEELLGFISLITWEQSSFKCIREEGEATTFHLLYAWWASVFNLLLEWEDFSREWLGVAWAMGSKGGGEGKVTFG